MHSAFPNVQSSNRNSHFVEPGHTRILAWLPFLLACHITQVPCSGTDLEVIKQRVHHGWLVLLNAKFGQVLWSRNQEDLFTYSLWCMGPYGDGATTLSQIHPPSFRAPIGLMLCFFPKTLMWERNNLILSWCNILLAVYSLYCNISLWRIIESRVNVYQCTCGPQ